MSSVARIRSIAALSLALVGAGVVLTATETAPAVALGLNLLGAVGLLTAGLTIRNRR